MADEEAETGGDDDPRIFNGFDVGRVLGASPLIFPSGETGLFKRTVKGPPDRFGKPTSVTRHYRTWAEVVAAFPNVDSWATVKSTTGEVWFPARFVREGLRWSRSDREGRKVSFVVDAVPCEEVVTGDWTSCCCGRPATGTGIATRYYGTTRGTREEVPLCARHVAVRRRRNEKDEERQARTAELLREDDERDAANRASNDWADRLRDEFGLDVLPIVRNGWGREDVGRLGVDVEAEKLYGLLVDIQAALRDFDLSIEEVRNDVRR